MKAKYKKIVGREFLILVGLAAVFGLTFLGLFIYNQINRSRSNEAYQQKMHVQEQLDSISNLPSYSKRAVNQWWLYSKFMEKYNMSEVSIDSLWSIYESLDKQTSIVFHWNQKNNQTSALKPFLQSIGFSSGEEFAKYISDNSIPTELVKEKTTLEKLISRHESDMSNLSKSKISSTHMVEIPLIVVLILAAILYFLRPLFYAIKWSVKAVKTNVED